MAFVVYDGSKTDDVDDGCDHYGRPRIKKVPLKTLHLHGYSLPEGVPVEVTTPAAIAKARALKCLTVTEAVADAPTVPVELIETDDATADGAKESILSGVIKRGRGRPRKTQE